MFLSGNKILFQAIASIALPIILNKKPRDQHVSVFHCRLKTKYVKATFDCLVCDRLFTSLAILIRHKEEAKHARQETSDGTSIDFSEEGHRPQIKKKKQNSKSMSNMMQQIAATNNSQDEGEKEENCAANNCIIESLEITPIF